ncbi:neurofibromin 1 [Fusarium oxysporum f. sp. radicis-lycopersici 26381]|nr:neurofibromin 1 [Fusarium oxysporum f. sp. radicis-lycopersici 26381]
MLYSCVLWPRFSLTTYARLLPTFHPLSARFATLYQTQSCHGSPMPSTQLWEPSSSYDSFAQLSLLLKSRASCRQHHLKKCGAVYFLLPRSFRTSPITCCLEQKSHTCFPLTTS